VNPAKATVAHDQHLVSGLRGIDNPLHDLLDSLIDHQFFPEQCELFPGIPFQTGWGENQHLVRETGSRSP